MKKIKKTQPHQGNIRCCRYNYQMFLPCRGFYPRGGGEVVVCTEPIRRLWAIDMTDPGNVTRIHGQTFCSGELRIDVSAKSEILAICWKVKGKEWQGNSAATESQKS